MKKENKTPIEMPDAAKQAKLAEKEAKAKQKALENEAKAKQKAIDDAAKAKEKAIKAEEKAKQKAIDDAAREKEKALKAKEKALKAEEKAKQKAIADEAKAKEKALKAEEQAKQKADKPVASKSKELTPEEKAAKEKEKLEKKAASKDKLTAILSKIKAFLVKIKNGIVSLKNKIVAKITNAKAAKEKELDGMPQENINKVSFFKSIKLKLIISFMLPVIGIIVLGTISYNKASEAVINNYITSSEQTVGSIKEYVSLVTEAIQSRYKGYLNDENIKQYFSGVMDSIASDGINLKETTRYDYQLEFYDNVNADSLISNMSFLSDDHQSITSYKMPESTTTPYTAYIESDTGKLVAADPFGNHWFGNACEADDALGTKSSVYALRYVKKLKDIKSVLVVDVDLKTILSALDTMDAGEGGYVAIVTADGSEIFSSTTKVDGKNIFTSEDFYKKALEGEALEGTVDVTFKGSPYKFIYSKVDSKNIMVCSLISEATFTSKVKDIQSLTMIVVVIVAAVAIVAGVSLSLGITKTIKVITDALHKVAGGDFTVRIKSRKKDEFRLITDSVNDTVTHVNDLIASVQDVNSEVVQATTLVNNASELFMESANNIKVSVDEIKAGTSRLDEDSDKCLSQMDKLSDKIETVTNNTNEIGRIVDATNASIMAGMSSVESVTESAESTTRITGEVIEAIQGLQVKSRSIVSIINAINDIAEESTLLSLNASIEAARAGEAGRGFAVVASEISKLADQSLNSAGKISNIINEIMDNTNQVVDIAKQAFEIVQAQNASVAGTTEAFDEMKNNINILLSSLEEITQNVVNIEGARNITLESVESISAVSAETSACSITVSDAVDSQTNATTELSNAASTLSDKSALLTELLSQFTV